MPQMGRQLDSDEFNGTPDMVLSLTRPESACVYIQCIWECSFSQPQDLLDRKLRNEIQAHPEVIMVLMVVIKEAGIYRGPAHGSTARNHFCNDESLQSIDDSPADFQDPGQALSQPTVVGGHTWCHIGSSEYYMWVKKGGEQIDISERDPEHTAHGLSMDAAEHMVNNGFQKIKDYIADMCGTMDPGTDVLQTEAISIALNLNTCFICLRAAAKSISYGRYRTSFESNFKPRDSPFLPTVHFRDSPPASDHEPPAESTTSGAASESPHSPGRGQLWRSARLPR
ncbi:hypothetical protein BDN67DRAFT_1012251 [Paxillus ammoniavirescens]|nr:hypothetical protein BDN67DRAFT_1012251 [Paxillus ammoniavirescens]